MLEYELDHKPGVQMTSLEPVNIDLKSINKYYSNYDPRLYHINIWYMASDV